MKTGLAYILVVLSVLSYSSATAQQENPSIRGKITKISPAADAAADKPLEGTLLVEGEKEEGADFDKVVVRVTGETKIFDATEGERRRIDLESLKVNDTVEVRLKSPILFSYPPQGGATEIVLIKRGRSE